MRCDHVQDYLNFNQINLIRYARSQIRRISLIKRLTKIIAYVLISIFLQPSLVISLAELFPSFRLDVGMVSH